MWAPDTKIFFRSLLQIIAKVRIVLKIKKLKSFVQIFNPVHFFVVLTNKVLKKRILFTKFLQKLNKKSHFCDPAVLAACSELMY